MKKIGIITVSNTNNFGAELQAYALQKKLQFLGFDTEIINYLYYKHKDYIWTKEAKPFVQFSISERVKNYVLYQLITPFLQNYISFFYSNIKSRLNNFETFHRKNICFSTQYQSLNELNQAKHPYDIFIVGSDQVWSPATATSLSPYFLSFVPKEKKRISYASSFGVSTIDEKYRPKYKDYLSNLESIAVREEDGVSLVKQISGREAKRVLDPTLLLTKVEWCKVIDKPQDLPKKFILIYMLHESTAIFNWAYYLQKECTFQIVMICKRAFFNKKYPNIINIEDAGPSQFIEIFSKASFVVTNSFHGTAFSVNFNVPFVTVLRKEKNNNSRMINFLGLVGLEKRIKYEEDAPESSDILTLDFSESNKKLNREMVDSVNYLFENLK